MEYTKENILKERFDVGNGWYSCIVNLKKSIMKNKLIIALIVLTLFASINIILINKFVSEISTIGKERYTYLEEYIK